MEKIKLNEIIVVEGKDDVTRLKEVVEATIIPLHGSVGLSKEKIDLIKNLSMNNKIILLTDPDFTGKKIREKINKNVSNIINLYVSRKEATLSGNVGVENVDKLELYNIFKSYLSAKDKKEEFKKNHIFTVEDMLNYGLIAENVSKQKREILGDILKIGYYNGKSLLNVLNGLNISKIELENAISIMNTKLEKHNRVGIIFGKFIPAHKGHINFIKNAATYVDKLYVTICFEKQRDEELLKKSTLPKMISEEDRIRFLKEELKNIQNIEILVLREEGIEKYPNGWLNWSKRVTEMLLKESIKISHVFTNEIQDKENYIKYFNDLRVFEKELNVVILDKNRFSYTISATKIRDNYEENKHFLPKNVVEFLEKK